MNLLDIAELPLEQLVPDPENLRLHNAKNLDAIRTSMEEVGSGRSVVIDEDGTILAGNGTMQIARERGMRVIVVDRPDRNTIIAVRVNGLSSREKKRLALWDNRSAELARWDKRALARLATDVPEQELLGGLFDEETLARLRAAQDDAFKAIDDDLETAYRCPSCAYEWSGQPKPKTAADGKAEQASAAAASAQTSAPAE